MIISTCYRMFAKCWSYYNKAVKVASYDEHTLNGRCVENNIYSLRPVRLSYFRRNSIDKTTLSALMGYEVLRKPIPTHTHTSYMAKGADGESMFRYTFDSLPL